MYKVKEKSPKFFKNAMTKLSTPQKLTPTPHQSQICSQIEEKENT